MKTIILAALAATLTLGSLGAQQNTPATAKAEPSSTTKGIALDSSKLTPAHVAKWKEINESVKDAAAKADVAELTFYRAKEARDKALVDGNAALAKMQAEANCAGCLPKGEPDGSLIWPRPEKPKEK